MASVNYKSGVYFYDFFFLGLLLSFIFRLMKGGMGRIDFKLFAIFFFVAVYFTLAFIIEGGTNYLIKDLRPFIFIIFFHLFWATFHRELIFKNHNEAVLYFLIAVILATLTNFYYLYHNSVNFNAIADKFYQNNSYRYLDASSYFCSVFLIYLSLNYRDFKHYSLLSVVAVVLSFSCILISNSRFLLLSIIISLLFANSKNLKVFILLSLASLACLSLFIALSEFVGASRVLSALSYDEIVGQLANRFYPALVMIEEMDWYNYIIGVGPGIPFYIPWFDYRDTIDPYNANLDSAYFTMYVKYGLLMLIPIIYFIQSIAVGCRHNIKQSVAVLLLMMFFVSATFYQIYAIGLIVGCGFISMIDLQKKCIQTQPV